MSREIETVGNTLRLTFVGKKDKRGEDYYFTTTSIPLLLDLSSACIHLFPFEGETEDDFGVTMVFRKYDKNWKQQSYGNTASRRRVQRKPDDVAEVDDDGEG